MSVPEKQLNRSPIDPTHPSSLITPSEHRRRQARLDKFQRRAANPKWSDGPRRRHADRLKIIDEMLNVSIEPEVIDVIMACLYEKPFMPGVRSRLKLALSVLKGEALDVAPARRPEPDPVPEPDERAVDALLSQLSEDNDPFARFWSDEEDGYVVSMGEGWPEYGIAKGDWLHLKCKTPDPGDLIVVPVDRTRFHLGFYVAGHGGNLAFQHQSGLARIVTSEPPLVVSKIEPVGGDDE